ncbi:MAG: DNA-directed RNA polymerase specialized sigma24 family protein [Gammaproteobacteria bacterium]
MTVTITSTGMENTGFLTGDGAVQEGVLDKRQAMDSFLAGIERRGYLMARIALRDPDAALDLVQDAMIKLVRNYSAKPAAEWQPLFFVS